MKVEAYQANQSQTVIQLFKNVFSNSEGEQEGIVIARLVTELLTTQASDLQGYVSLLEDDIIGCIFFSWLTLSNHQTAFILSPVATATQHHGKGLGQQLINTGIQQLKQQNVDLLLTYGDPRFYSKVGFTQIGEDLIKAPHKLSYPEGWLAQSLKPATSIPSKVEVTSCVKALDKVEYW